MAGSQLAELNPESTSYAGDEPRPSEFVASGIAEYVGRLSDRAIQRIVGGNAFLRGRLYVRRKAVSELECNECRAQAKILVRTAEEPCATQIELTADDRSESPQRIESHCSCAAWRGPQGHCKHVAAVLVALRDRQRPPREPATGRMVHPHDRSNGHSVARNGESTFEGQESGDTPERASVIERRATTIEFGDGGRNEGLRGVTSLSKRRRLKRRTRGEASEGGQRPEILSTRRALHGVEARSNGADPWMPDDALTKPLDFEYRMVVRAASIAVTPMLAGSRSAVAIGDALANFNAVAASERPLLRALLRQVNRAQPTTAELRGEEAAEALGMLRGRRVLLEPASMELRFADEPLRPKIELDLTAEQSLRTRVFFQVEGSSRKFALTHGAWFEGTPGWHLDVTEGVARPLADTVTPAWLQRLYRSPALVHPLEEMPRILTEFIPRMAASLGTGLPDLTSVADLVDAEPHLQLRIDGDIVGAQARLRVVYAGSEMSVPLRGLPAPLAFLPALAGRSRPRVVRREVGIELAAVQRLLDLGFAYEDESKALVVQGEAAIRFWIEGIASLPEEWERFIPNDLVDVRIREQSVQPRMRVASGVDWLSLDMSFEVEGVAVDEHELRSCLEHGRRLVKLADGSYAPVEAAKVGEVLERMAEIFVGTGTRKKLPLSQAGRVQDLMRLLGSESEAGSPTDSLLNKLGNLEKVELLSKPRALKAELRPYQKQGFSWLGFLHEIGTGGILADDMGLGKTLQTIALLTWLKANDTRAKRAHSVHLVVAPTSVVPNWQREIERFAPGLRTLVWQGPDRHDRKAELAEVDVVITNYALLRRDEDLWLEREFAYIILDEAQHIKNPLSTTARVAKKLRSERRLALTGTPIENRLSEIWSIFDFVSPGLLGSLTRFEENYARPIDRGDAEASERLRHAIHPFILRRTKREVAQDLPAKIEQEIVVPLTDAQSTLYRQMLKQVRDSVLSEIDEQGIGKAQIHILAALTRLRQVACDPRLTKLPGEWTHDESGKLSALREILSEAAAGGHRVLVFSQFVEMLKLIREALDQDGITYRYLDGSTQDRMSLVDDFNGNDSITTFLISLKAGGSGLNLTGADTVVHFDPWWNPAVEDQATDRAHRIGQERVVTVYRLIARGTVEEKILQLSEKKRSLISHVLTSDGGPLKGLTRADVAELFGD